MMNGHFRKAVTRAAILVALSGPVAGAAFAQQDRLGDRSIADAIAIDLTANRDIRAARVSVEVNDGVAQLTGAVDTLLARRRAGEIASATIGVSAVVNDIKVRASNRTDAQIAAEIDRALLDDPATESFEIEPAVDDGLVTLRGTVESWQERRLAEAVAAGVRGVRGIERNNIRVDYARDRSDTEIRTEVQARLANDVRVDDMMIDVTAEDGRVTLSGAVGSDAEARLAEVLARVGGVKEVENDLDVRWWARDRMRRSASQTPSDEAIARSVRTAFLYDPRVSLFEIEVSVENGVVTLRGDVDNLQARRMAKILAIRNIGVLRARNMISVRPDDVPEDDLLESRARTALMRDAYIDTADLTLRVVNGHAMLDGNVNTMFEKQHAADVVSRVQGIVHIDNGLDTRYDWTWKSDDELIDDVNDQLFWSPFVDSEDITATARNGVVTLQGVIESWSERQNAIENAFEGGARDVIDELEFDIDA